MYCVQKNIRNASAARPTLGFMNPPAGRNVKPVLPQKNLDCVHTMPAHFENGEKCDRSHENGTFFDSRF